MVSATSPLLTRIEHLLRSARQDLQTSSGGTPLCRIDRSPAWIRLREIKRAEGRAAALSVLRRALRAEGTHTGRRPEDLVTRIATQWQRLEAVYAGRGQADWEAYAQGGLEALRQLQADLQDAGPTPLGGATGTNG